MEHWLIKSEPGEWSWRDQMRAGRKGTFWNGVRNHSGKLNLMAMRVGEQAFFYLSNEGKESILSILKEGDFFGEMGVLDASPRSATIKALGDVEVAILSRKDFLDMLARSAQMSLRLVLTLSSRLRATNQAIQAASYQDIRTRLASLLINLEKNFGERVEGGTRLTLRLTNQEMANMIGTTRETVNRMLNRFWDEKLIDMRTANVVITDHDKLQAILR